MRRKPRHGARDVLLGAESEGWGEPSYPSWVNTAQVNKSHTVSALSNVVNL